MIKIILQDADKLEQWHLKNAEAFVETVKDGRRDNTVFKEYKKNLEIYLLAPPSEHSAIESKFQVYSGDVFKEFTNTMKDIYNRYSQTYGYELVKRIGLQTCPYCNRAYIFVATRNNGKGVRPELDHFVPKSVVPALALNLYNLIPACPSCNHLKKTQRLKCNPYLKTPSEVFKLTDVADASSLKLLPEDSDYNTVLLLDKLYAQHQDYVQEILDKAVAYNNSAYEGLLADFQAMAKTPAELDRLVWGTYLEESEYHKRPLSKLTGDILKQLGII